MIARYPPEDVLLVEFAGFLKRQEGDDTAWMLERFIRYLKRKNLAWDEEIPIHKLAVHPFHVRYAPPDVDARRFSSLVRLAESRHLSNPLIVTPSGTGDLLVATNDDEVYSAVLEFCRRKGLRRPDGRIDYFVILMVFAASSRRIRPSRATSARGRVSRLYPRSSSEGVEGSAWTSSQPRSSRSRST